MKHFLKRNEASLKSAVSPKFAKRLFVSEACPLILPYYIAIDNAREIARSAKAIRYL
ncbi:adenylosuccinate synthetase [Vibrio chagasii]|nr:adenylosuccinate synthetase [Vibrio chagasii]